MKHMFGCLLTCLAAGIVQGAASAAPIQWQPGFNSARELAQKSGKLIMADFYADWNPLCKRLNIEVLQDPRVVTASRQFLPVKVDAEGPGKELAKMYFVDALPSILFIDGSGDVVDVIPGVEAPERFAADLSRIAKQAQEYPQLEATVQAHPDDIDAGARLAPMLVQRGHLKQAQALATRIESHGAVARAKLAPTYNRMGDIYLYQHQAANAAGWYRKTLADSKDTDLMVDAHFKLALAALMQKDVPDGRAEIQKVLDLPNAPAAAKARAKQLLGQLK